MMDILGSSWTTVAVVALVLLALLVAMATAVGAWRAAAAEPMRSGPMRSGPAYVTGGREGPGASAPGKLAGELERAGWKMYGSEQCGACHAQLAMLGAEFGGGLAVDCRAEACPGVEAYPTWVRGDDRRVGKRTVEELREMARR